MRLRELLVVLFCLIGALSWSTAQPEASGAAKSSATRVVVDMRGKKVTIPEDPTRVVIVDKGFIAQVMRALGVEERLVATGGLLQTGNERPEDRDTLFLCPRVVTLPNIGYTLGGFNYEALAKAKPDLVLWRNSEYIKDNEITQQAMKRIEDDFGIPLVVINGPGCYPVPQIETHYKGIELLGQVFGREEQAHSLVGYLKEQLEMIMERTSRIPDTDKPAVLYIGLRNDGGVGVVWGGTFGDAKFSREVANIRNAYPEQSRQIMSAEQIIALNPEVIILATNSVTPNPDILFKDPTYASLAPVAAVRNRRVASLGLLTWWGDFRLEFPTILLIAAKGAYPHRFRDVSIHRWLSDYHQRLYRLTAAEAERLSEIQQLDWMQRYEF